MQPVSVSIKLCDMVIRAVFCLLFLFSSIASFASNDTSERDTGGHSPHYLDFTAGLLAYGSDPGYSLELSYAFFPVKYVGASLGLEFTRMLGSDGTYIDLLHDINEDDAKVMHFNLNPSVCFRSPILWFKGHESGLQLQVSPGAQFTMPKRSVVIDEHNGSGIVMRDYEIKCDNSRYVFWRVKSSVSWTDGQSHISLGYSMSNYDVYVFRRNLSFNGKKIFSDGRHKFLHTFFVSVGTTIFR